MREKYFNLYASTTNFHLVGGWFFHFFHFALSPAINIKSVSSINLYYYIFATCERILSCAASKPIIIPHPHHSLVNVSLFLSRCRHRSTYRLNNRTNAHFNCSIKNIFIVRNQIVVDYWLWSMVNRNKYQFLYFKWESILRTEQNRTVNNCKMVTLKFSSAFG